MPRKLLAERKGEELARILEKERRKAEKDISAREEEITRQEQKVATLQAELSDQTTKVKVLETKQDSLNTKIDNLEATASRERITHQEKQMLLKTQLNSSQAELLSLQQDHAALKDEM
jgi:uncharacterized protein (DUF3084 family)